MIFNLFGNKSIEPEKKIVVTCRKHGVVPNYEFNVEGKRYFPCWHCIGEYTSSLTTMEEIEVRGEK